MMKPFLLVALAVCAPLSAAMALEARTNPIAVSRSVGSQLKAAIEVRSQGEQSWTRVSGQRPQLVIGEHVAVCVRAPNDGYLSIWSRTSDGARPVRIFPNDFTPEQRQQRAGRLKANQEICVGNGKNGYVFEVGEPYGVAEVYVHWSGSLEGQFGPEDMPLIPDPGERSLTPKGLMSAGGSDDPAPVARYSSTTIEYQVSR